MRHMLSAVTLCLGEITGSTYAKTYMKIKKVDRRLSLENVRPKMVILDVGGGLGLDDLLFAYKGAYSVVVDLSCRDLKRGKKICKDLKLYDNFHHLIADARQLPFKNGSFDMVTSFSAVEHLPQRREFKVWIREMVRVLKNGGKFVLTTSNKLWIMYPIAKMKIALNFHSPNHFFTPKELMNELKRCKLLIDRFDAGAIFYREHSLIPLPKEFGKHLENLLNRLERFNRMRIICARMGFRCTKKLHL